MTETADVGKLGEHGEGEGEQRKEKCQECCAGVQCIYIKPY